MCVLLLRLVLRITRHAGRFGRWDGGRGRGESDLGLGLLKQSLRARHPASFALCGEPFVSAAGDDVGVTAEGGFSVSQIKDSVVPVGQRAKL